MAETQKRRVLNAVRSLFYQALGDQKLLEVRGELARLASRAVAISRELANVGQADKPDVLASEIEAQRADLALVSAGNARTRTWRQLATAVNDLTLQPSALEGDLERVPPLDAEAAVQKIFSESPELRAAEIGSARSELALRRAKIEKIPDLMIRGGVRYNRELLEQGGPAGLRPVGREGFFDIGVEVPLFNRYQGRVEAARADAEKARLEVERTRLTLRSRLAALYKEYSDARSAAERYRTSMIPAARQAYELYTANFRQMAAAYPQVLIAQRNLFQLQEDYIASLVSCWKSYVEIQGLLTE
jgi:cobalt-zinc-cadmium efflux system outer membrane protein